MRLLLLLVTVASAADSLIAHAIQDIREWHAAEPDWRATRSLIAGRYGYDTYGGNCHMIPNHALIILGLLYGAGDLRRSLAIVNTAGWDTDCNSGNLGCLLGIRNGLGAFDAASDLREPVADRLYLSTADGGRGISDALIETHHIANIGRALAGLEPIVPKGGARFHFGLPGAVQGFQAESGAIQVENVAGHSRLGQRSLALRYRLAAGEAGRVATPIFIPPEMVAETHYMLMAAPTLYPGQTVRASLAADSTNAAPISCRLFLRAYAAHDALTTILGPDLELAPGAERVLTWPVGVVEGAAIAQLGIEIAAVATTSGSVYLDAVSWDGAPDVTFTRPSFEGTLWRRVWVNAMDHFEPRWPEPFHLSQDSGRGLLITGTADWMDYAVESTIVPHLAAACGIAARVQGLRRYYAVLLRPGDRIQLVRLLGEETVLAERTAAWSYDSAHTLRLQVEGGRIRAWLDGEPCFDVRDDALSHGGVALLCEEGRIVADAVTVRPIAPKATP